jgi:hypothetical protein
MHIKEKNIIFLSCNAAVTEAAFDAVIQSFDPQEPLAMDSEVKETILSPDGNGLKVILAAKSFVARLNIYHKALHAVDEGIVQQEIDRYIKDPLNDLLVYCFSDEQLVNGLYGFGMENGSNMYNYQLTMTFLRNHHIRAICVICVREESSRDPRWDWLFQQPLTPDQFIRGSKLAELFNPQQLHIDQLKHFLALPTYVVINNKFLPKIPV